MIELNNEKEVHGFFKDQTLKFKILCDRVAEYETTTPINIDGSYYDFTISFFYNNDDGLLDYSKINGMLFDLQVFEVLIHYPDNSKETIYNQKYIDYNNN